MAKFFLVRNDCRNLTYQKLAGDLAAIEPPIWMMLREQMLKAEGHEVRVIDTQADVYNFYDVICLIKEYGADHIELFPTGNHPSAYIQQRDDISLFLEHLKESSKTLDVHYNMKFSPIGIKSNWESFDLSKYRAHNWHCNWGSIPRNPYAVIYTSLGCPFHCQFCCIKEFYGVSYAERDIASVVGEIRDLVKIHGVRNVKVMDEIFFYKPKRVEELCDALIAEGYDLNIWAYARIDTVNERLLKKLKFAGFNWLGLGIESGNEDIRKKVQKGTFTNEKIREVIQMIKSNGIHIGGNFIFGFPDDTYDTMTETLDFARELKCEFTNLYTMMAYPGSELYETAKKEGWDLPSRWAGYSQYSYHCHPVRTHHLTSEQVLKFRDDAFMSLYTDGEYLRYLSGLFGSKALEELAEVTKIKLKRKLLEDGAVKVNV